MITILDQRYRTARKNHVCDFCGHRIDKGERYQISKQAADGSAHTWKSCAWHAAASRWIFREWNYEYQDGLGGDDMMANLGELWNDAMFMHEKGVAVMMPFDWTKEDS